MFIGNNNIPYPYQHKFLSFFHTFLQTFYMSVQKFENIREKPTEPQKQKEERGDCGGWSLPLNATIPPQIFPACLPLCLPPYLSHWAALRGWAC